MNQFEIRNGVWWNTDFFPEKQRLFLEESLLIQVWLKYSKETPEGRTANGDVLLEEIRCYLREARYIDERGMKSENVE